MGSHWKGVWGFGREGRDGEVDLDPVSHEGPYQVPDGEEILLPFPGEADHEIELHLSPPVFLEEGEAAAGASMSMSLLSLSLRSAVEVSRAKVKPPRAPLAEQVDLLLRDASNLEGRKGDGDAGVLAPHVIDEGGKAAIIAGA